MKGIILCMSNLVDKFYEIVKALAWVDKVKNGEVPAPKGVDLNGQLEFFEDPSISIGMSGIAKQFARSIYKTIVYEYKGQTVTGDLEVVNERYGGAISEIAFLSPNTPVANKTYSVQITTDGNDVYNDSFANFEVKSNYLGDMSALDDGTNFILTFNTIFFNESVRIRVYGAEGTVFTTIYVKAIKRLFQR